MNSDTKSLLFNIIGGIIVVLLTEIWINIRYRLSSCHLQRLLGFKFKNKAEVRMAYGQLMLLQQEGKNHATHPYIKPPRKVCSQQNLSYSIERPVSECEVRSSNYISTLFGRSGNLRPMLVSDIDTDDLLDSNFISFGGSGSNYKTSDILTSIANIFIRMYPDHFALPSGEELPYRCSSTIDYGFILRITPPQFPARSWIACAGLGEWGTSGSSWFLANKWKELIEKIDPCAYRLGIRRIPDFMALIQVQRGIDQSATILKVYRNDKGQLKVVK